LEVFGPIYSEHYDLLYDDKDYEAECDLLEEVFQRFGDGHIHDILDLGCGTGNHAICLACRGYRVTGVDRSKEMLDRFQQKVLSLDLGDNKPAFECGDVRTVDLDRTFDAVLMMFAVLGYQPANDNVVAALRAARRHLRPGGLLVFDVWYGPAVLAIRPGDRVKVISTDGDSRLIRVASGKLDVRHHLCEVQYHLWQLTGDRVASETEETHQMRFFFPMELELFLRQTGFESLVLSAFPSLEQLPDETTWNVLVVAQALAV
jgi:SAM-dependent methyltransferase